MVRSFDPTAKKITGLGQCVGRKRRRRTRHGPSLGAETADLPAGTADGTIKAFAFSRHFACGSTILGHRNSAAFTKMDDSFPDSRGNAQAFKTTLLAWFLGHETGGFSPRQIRLR
jgi:hypothetical protein